MTQAPTPGPLSVGQEETIAFNLCAVHGFEPDFVKTQRDFALAVIREYEVVYRPRLAPTAPVEASGSFEERALMLTKKHGNPVGTDYEQGQNDMGHRMVTMAREADAAIAALSPQPSGFIATLTDDQRAETLAYTGDDTHPQPSGETRERLTHYPDYISDAEGLERIRSRLLEIKDWHDLPGAIVNCNSLARLLDTIEMQREQIAILSARPLALGGQQGDRSDRYYEALVQADLKIRSLPGTDQSDVEFIRDALSTTPARAEAQDEGAAGEPVAWRTRLRKGGWRVSTEPVSLETVAEYDRRWPGDLEVQPLFAHPSSPPSQDEEAAGECGKSRGQVAYEGWAQGLPGCEWANQTRTQQRAWEKAAQAVIDAHPSPTPAADADRVRAWDAFAAHSNWELSHGYPDGEEEDGCWLVHSVNGGRNDREWTLIGRGQTPDDAIQAALQQETQT